MRFFFEAPRRPKGKAGLKIKSLLVRCPSTSKLTDTGKTVDEKRWAATKVSTQKFRCAHCGQIHVWTKKDVVLGRPLQ